MALQLIRSVTYHGFGSKDMAVEPMVQVNYVYAHSHVGIFLFAS